MIGIFLSDRCESSGGAPARGGPEGVVRFRCGSVAFVQNTGAPLEPSGVSDVGAVADPGQQAPARTLAFFQPRAQPVESEGGRDPERDDRIELDLDRGSEAPAGEPDGEDEDAQEDLRQGGAHMGEVEPEKQVVEVRFVRTEGRGAPQDAAGHDPQRVEDRDDQHRQDEGDEAEVAVRDERERRIALEQADDEIGHDHAHHQRASVAQEHFGLVAEDVVDEEGDQGAGEYRGERGAFLVARPDGHHAEGDAGRDAVARAEAVHAVDEVDGVDDARAGEDRQRNGDPVGNGVDAPQTVKVVDVSRTAVNEQHEDQNLHEQAEKGRKGEYVVHRSDVEHQGEGAHDREHFRRLEFDACDQQRHDDAEEHRHAPQTGHGDLLQLAGVRIVGNVFQDGDSVDVSKNPPGAQHGRDEQDQVVDFHTLFRLRVSDPHGWCVSVFVSRVADVPAKMRSAPPAIAQSYVKYA